MDTSVLHSEPANIAESRKKMFDDFVAHLRMEEVLIDTKLARKESEEFFNALGTNNFMKAAQFSSVSLHNTITQHLVKDFLNELFVKRNADIINIGLDLSGQEVLVWAIINDNDEKAETALFRAESATNAKFESLHYNISVTVLEKSDNVKIPSQYFKLEKVSA